MSADVRLRVLSPRSVLLGTGDSSALQNVDTTELPDGARCWVTEQQAYYELHKYDFTTIANFPTVMVPGSGPGRWINRDQFYDAAGNAPNGWRDLVGQIGPGTGASMLQVGGSDFQAFQFDIGEFFFNFYHINHDYKLGSPIYLHVHWLTDGTSVEPVGWKFQYVYAKGHNQQNYDFGSGGGTEVTLLDTPQGTPFRHLLTEMVTPISNSDFEPDGILWVKITRVTNGAIDNTDQVFALTADCHYQTDSIASKNRKPNFYA